VRTRWSCEVFEASFPHFEGFPVAELHVPQAALSVMTTPLPELEAVRVVISAEYENRKDDEHRLDVDTALQSMPRLRELRFVLSIFRPSEHTQFNDGIRQKLPLASEAGLLSWSTCSWHKLRHPLASIFLIFSRVTCLSILDELRNSHWSHVVADLVCATQ
jgi:hypothetical protein